VKLADALQILNEAGISGSEAAYPVLLSCGFSPLHLETFLAAHLQRGLAGRRVKVSTGLYGDLAGTLEQELPGEAQGAAVVVEWPDLDARLGYRSLGGWGPRQETEIVAQVQSALDRLGRAIEAKSRRVPVAVAMPTLPLAPAFHTRDDEAGEAELAIRSGLAQFAARVGALPGVVVASSQRLLELSPPERRFDLRSELLTGHPYSLSHADAVGGALARLLLPAAPKKGLITDLDDTLWRGLVGEIGAEAVAWDLDHHAQLHGLYQQLLAGLAGQGVLLGIASKNDPENVEKVFQRRDVHLSSDQIFPMEVHWKPKSESVSRILATWNVGADSVVFIDDNPMELAEVKAAWPEITCLLFPKNDATATLGLFRTLRNLFGKRQLEEEDGLRLASIRASAELPGESVGEEQQDLFLSRAEAVLSAHFDPPSGDGRVRELVNKTNQFNLNGRRYSEAEWQQSGAREGGFVLLVSYEDKFGPLGKIAVLAGEREDRALRIHTWVMSCRAFSRRIEYGCMDLLFSHFSVDELRFDFAATPKNGPLRACCARFLGAEPEKPFVLRRDVFRERCPSLYFQVDATV